MSNSNDGCGGEGVGGSGKTDFNVIASTLCNNSGESLFLDL